MEFSFDKNKTVKALEAVPEQFRGLYAEAGDGFELKAELATVAEAIDGLNKANKAARNDAKTVRAHHPGQLDKWKPSALTRRP